MSRRKKNARRAPPDAKHKFLNQQATLTWLMFFVLSVVVFVAYSPAINGGMIWDDDGHVTKPALRTWHGLTRIWFELGATQQYYPLLHSAFWVEHKLWGDAVIGYHLANIVQHLCAAGLLLLILKKLQIPGAELATAIFALHPVNVESVAWISEQKNTLSAVFYMGACLLYLDFDEQRRASKYLWASLLFILGLLIKTVIATLPAALLVIFWWKRGTLSRRRDVVPLIPWFVLGLIAGLFTAWVERALIGAEGADFHLTWVERGLLASRVVWFYFSEVFWPSNLIFIYPRWNVDQAIWWQWLFPLAGFAVTAGLWIVRKKYRAPLAGWLFFVGTLFPVLGFCNVFPFLFSYVADHFQYLASLGIIVPFSAGVVLLFQHVASSPAWEIRRQQLSRIGLGLCLCLLATLGALTWNQSRMYADAMTLYRTTIDKNPACWMAYNNLGALLIVRDRPEEALENLKQAIRLKADYADAFNNLGLASVALNKLPEAADYHRQATLLDPEIAQFHDNLGIVLGRLNEPQNAAEEFRRALSINPNFIDSLTNLGSALTQLNQPAEAIRHLHRALQLNPDFALAYMNLAVAYDELGRPTDAQAAAEKALILMRMQGQITMAQQISKWLVNHQAKHANGN